MNATELAAWRDTALILLVLQAIVLGLLPAVALYGGLQGIRRLLQWIRPVLFQARLYVWRIQRGVWRAMNAVAAPFIWVQSVVAGVQRALHILGWR